MAETLKWMVIALVAGIVFGFIVGASPDPLTIVQDPVTAIQSALSAVKG